MRLGVVIVTYESRHVLDACLRGLAEHEPDAHVVVVDNASPGGPPMWTEAPAATSLVVAEANRGYGAACNRGAVQLGDVDVLAFLNPDLTLLGPSLSEIATGMEGRPGVGVATGPVVDGGGDRVPSAWGPTSAVRAFAFASGWQMSRVRRVAGRVRPRGVGTSAVSTAEDDIDVDGHVLGGAMLVAGGCWDRLGGFDERYFMYWEDADLCQRARDAGWGVAVLPATPMLHREGSSSEGVLPADRWPWYAEGARRFVEVHLSAWQGRRVLAALYVGERLRRGGNSVG